MRGLPGYDRRRYVLFSLACAALERADQQITLRLIGAASAPLVCTDGMPAAAQRTLLLALAATGAKLRYHGDFDWAGLRIAATVMSICGAAPWRFTREHYLDATARFAGAPLVGNPAPCPWDPSLADAMQGRGLAIPEEATIDDLIEDLAR